MMWKSTSSNGKKYLFVWGNLGSSLIYANYELFNWLLF